MEPVAIIGIGCRFPGADNPDAFWRLLCNGTDAITEAPARRWDVDQFYDPAVATPGKINTRYGGFLEKIDEFDAGFFGISPREAAHMDPQQRILLEVVWEALEDGGQVIERLAGTPASVFIGISTFDYGLLSLLDLDGINTYTGTGIALSIAANRISYLFDLRGPSMVIDTACSSSLMAVHLACQSLWLQESNLAIAGGANLILSPNMFVGISKGRVLSPDGHCKTFSALANGYVRGEGAGVVILKPLAQAFADRDSIYAVIRGSAANQDGRTNGLTAPNRWAQEAVLKEAYRRAQISPGRARYIEAHGTGTLLGDPIEMKALGSVLNTDQAAGMNCTVGSVKTNIGHLESAAGIAGLIKVALILKHGQIPPSLHSEPPNPHIPFDDLALRVQTTLTPWPEGTEPGVAGVSAFGVGGTNVHVVLQGETKPEVSKSDRETVHTYLLPISARSPEALHDLVRSYLSICRADPLSLSDFCHTASVRRSHHKHRLALVFHDWEELFDRLKAFLSGETSPSLSFGLNKPGRSPKLVFVFSGQGSQWNTLGAQLFEQEPVFRSTLRQCDEALRQFCDWSITEELTGGTVLNGRQKEQPAVFALQVALANLWHSWGVSPDAIIGHSMGEVAAAHIAGALTLEDASRVIFHRNRLMHRLEGKGSMASVELSMEQARMELEGYEDRLSIAAINSPASIVLSGEPAALDNVLERLKKKGIFCRLLPVTYASHSPQMESLQEEFVEALSRLNPRPASIPFYSAVNGGLIDGQELDANYWSRNIREPVRFAAAIEEAAKNGNESFLEIGPHPVLSTALSQCFSHLGKRATVLASLRSDKEERASMLESLATLYAHGHSVNWSALYPHGGEKVQLPLYPWQRERYPLPATTSLKTPEPVRGRHQNIHDWFYRIEWQSSIPAETCIPEGEQSRNWLIFSDSRGVGQTLHKLMSIRDQNCILVCPGACFNKLEANVYQIRPEHPEDFRELLEAQINHLPFRGIVHLWSLETPQPEDNAPISFSALEHFSCINVLYLLQAMAHLSWKNVPRLWLVTSCAQAVDQFVGRVAISQSPVWGLGRVIMQEHPELHCSIVDLSGNPSPEEMELLFQEILSNGSENQIALRNGTRYVARLTAVAPLGETDLSASRSTLFHSDRTYLITGGLGALGLMLARWMVEEGARHLVLMARSGPTPEAKKVLEALDNAGARIVIAGGDVTQKDFVEKILEEIEQTMPPLRGIIHAAGVLDDGILLRLDSKRFVNVMSPKVIGAWNLHHLTLAKSLDFFVLFSSAVSLLGASGVGNYAAANSFLDALAHHRRSLGRTALSINWSPWADSGMANKLKHGRRVTIREKGSVTPTEGLDALRRLLHLGISFPEAANGTAQVAVLPLSLQDWFLLDPASNASPLFACLREEQPHGQPEAVHNKQGLLLREQLLAMGSAERTKEMQKYLVQQVAEVLRAPVNKLDPEQALSNLGIDSLMAVELKIRIEGALGTVIPVMNLLEGPSVSQLADQLLQQLV